MDKWYDKNQLIAYNKPIKIVVEPRNRVRRLAAYQIMLLKRMSLDVATDVEREYLRELALHILDILGYAGGNEYMGKELLNEEEE